MIEIFAVFLVIMSIAFAFGFAFGYEVGKWRQR